MRVTAWPRPSRGRLVSGGGRRHGPCVHPSVDGGFTPAGLEELSTVRRDRPRRLVPGWMTSDRRTNTRRATLTRGCVSTVNTDTQIYSRVLPSSHRSDSGPRGCDSPRLWSWDPPYTVPRRWYLTDCPGVPNLCLSGAVGRYGSDTCGLS